MEHGKFSVSKIWHIAKMEYIKLIMDPRMILIVAALVFAYQFITVPLLQNVQVRQGHRAVCRTYQHFLHPYY